MHCGISSSANVMRRRTPSRLCLPACCCLLLLSQVSGAAELREVTVERNDNRYSVVSQTYFDVSAESLYRVLIDYDLFTRFTSAFAESRNKDPDEQGRPQFYTRMEGCVLWWCKSFERNGYLLLTPGTEIVAIGDPDTSNFDYSHERWRLWREGKGTLLIYEFEMEPGFWVPPLIGPFVIKRTLRDSGADAVDRIEAVAREKQAQSVANE